MEIEGACGHVAIHCDATQTEEKKLEERERQRQGETPKESNAGAEFLEEMDSPEVLVWTSKSGSMTQEIFLIAAKVLSRRSKKIMNRSSFSLTATPLGGTLRLSNACSRTMSACSFLLATPRCGRSQTTVDSTKESTGPQSKFARNADKEGAGHPNDVSMKFFHWVGGFSVRLKPQIFWNVSKMMQPERASELGFSRWIHLLKPGPMQLMDLALVTTMNAALCPAKLSLLKRRCQRSMMMKKNHFEQTLIWMTKATSAIFMLLKFKLQESQGSGGEMSRRGLARERKFPNVESCTHLEPLLPRIAKSL
jgi:hypothetical protein